MVEIAVKLRNQAQEKEPALACWIPTAVSPAVGGNFITQNFPYDEVTFCYSKIYVSTLCEVRILNSGSAIRVL